MNRALITSILVVVLGLHGCDFISDGPEPDTDDGDVGGEGEGEGEGEGGEGEGEGEGEGDTGQDTRFDVVGGEVSFIMDGGATQVFGETNGTYVGGGLNTEISRLEIRARTSDAWNADGIGIEIRDLPPSNDTYCSLTAYLSPISYMPGDCSVEVTTFVSSELEISGTFSGSIRQTECCSTLGPEQIEISSGTFSVTLAPIEQ
jgi:hypothetical protein